MMLSRCHPGAVLAGLAVCALFYFLWRPQHLRSLKTQMGSWGVYERRRRELVGCVLDTRGATYWDSLVDRVAECVQRFTRISPTDLEQFHMGRFGEVKVFLPLVAADVSCNEVTIGIGGDTKVEKEFHAKYPTCKIFGIEPAADQAVDFASIGTVIPHAVGITAGRLPMTIRQPNGGYKKVEVEIRPLPSLLKEFVGTLLIHYTTIDIEGFDYNLMDALRFDQPFDKAGVTFCQIDVEMHGRDKQAADFDFEKFLPRFLLETAYVPVFASSFIDVHKKLTLINVDRPECERAFAFSRYFIDA